MKKAQPGYILFLLFAMLTACSVLISLFFSQTMIFNQQASAIIMHDKAYRLNASVINALKVLLTKDESTKNNTNNTGAHDAEKKDSTPSVAIYFKKIFPFFRTNMDFSLNTNESQLKATLKINAQSEEGKLNINSLYDFEKKEFLGKGSQDDKEKLCKWLFETIAKITKKPSLFEPFKKYLSSKDFDCNEVTELLQIKEFQEVFCNTIFIENNKNNKNEEIFLTDIFTVSTEQETINPWLLSPSWCALLGLQPEQNMPEDKAKKFLESITTSCQWNTDWDLKLKDFYKKEFKDIPQEIKSILTTDLQANIFSLLLQTNINETNSSIFTIVKIRAKDDLIEIETLKTYQI